MEVLLSKKAIEILANPAARKQLSDAMGKSSKQRKASPPKISIGNVTYTLVDGLEIPISAGARK